MQMGTAEQFRGRSREVARRFLQTAVVVDDEAYMRAERREIVGGSVVTPGRRGRAAEGAGRSAVGRATSHTLNAKSVIDAFARLGVVCGVVGPGQAAMETMRRADIVVLDWQLREGDPNCAIDLLRDLLSGEVDRNSLRLVAIYTGEGRLEDICEAVFARLGMLQLDPVKGPGKGTISYRHGRVVVYAKSDVNLAKQLKERSIAEEYLPERLVEDFAAMTEGLLPRIALTSLTAVREGSHMVLDQFSAELDPAFLAHRACLPDTDDAEQHIVNHVAEELRGLMDNAVAAESPAGGDAVEGWMRLKRGTAERFDFGGKVLDLEQAVTLAREGLRASVLGNNAFRGLSGGFAGGEVVDLDERLAWIMGFRTVFSAPPPRLWLGSVITGMIDGEQRHLMCMRPRCDCVRLGGKTSFFFLPLVEPGKLKEQLVVKLGTEFRRLGIDLDPTGWVRLQFEPSGGGGTVTAAREEPSGSFVFADVSNRRYTWQGELRAEFAQRVAQALTMTLSRVAVDESEWLRRIAGKGD